MRHSPDDARIDVSARRIDSWVEFRVRDYGAGIRPEHQSRVFDRYFKAAAVGQLQGSGQSSGTGLGLAISSEFIKSMNGQIGLDTSVTDGAAFYFRLAVVWAVSWPGGEGVGRAAAPLQDFTVPPGCGLVS